MVYEKLARPTAEGGPPAHDASSEVRLAAVQAACPPVFVLGGRPARQTIVAAGTSLVHWTGRPLDQLLGLPLSALVDPATEASDWATLTRCLVRLEPGRGRIRLRRPNGAVCCVDLHLAPARTADGSSFVLCTLFESPVLLSATSTEPRGPLFARVAQARDDWMCAIDSLSDLVLVVDTSLCVLRANRTLEQWGLGSVTDVQGRDLHRVVHPHCREERCYVEAIREAIADPLGAPSLDWSLTDPTLGRRLQVMVHALSGRSDGPHMGAATIVIRDATAQHHLVHAQMRTNRVDAMRHMVEGLAHEIGNPAAAMKATVEVWSRCFADFSREEHRTYLERVRGGIDRLLETVTRVLGRGDGGVRTLCAIPVGDMLVRSAEFLADRMRQTEVKCEVVTPQDPTSSLMGDPLVVDQIMRNLIENSIEACSGGGRITLEGLVGPGWAEVSVRDTGRGMTSHTLENLFVPFFTTRASGTGLGLAHVSRWMAEMGGDIQVQSSEGAGTLITLRFRLGSSEEPPGGRNESVGLAETDPERL